MAKKSSIEKNNRRRKLAKKYSGRRSRLKAIAQDKSVPMEERFAAALKLAHDAGSKLADGLAYVPGESESSYVARISTTLR